MDESALLLNLEHVIDHYPIPDMNGCTMPGAEIFQLFAKLNLTSATFTLVLEMIDKVSKLLGDGI